MKEFTRGYLPISYMIHLSKYLCLKTQIERKIMKMISYTLVMLCIKPFASYVLSVTSRYKSNLSESHQKIIKNIFKYLKRIKNVFLVYEGDELVVHGYLDTSFQLDNENKIKNSFFLYFTLNNGVMSWKSSK